MSLIRLKRPVFVGGAAQVLLTIAVMGLPLVFFDVGLGKSLFIGFLAALSSTAIVLKVLGEKAQLAAPHGRIALGALIFQDVAVVPMMLLVPLLAGASGNPWLSLGEMLLKGAFVAGVIFIGARKVVPLILGAVIRTRSRELFLMSTLGLCFAIALLTSTAGLSLSLGAFLAGLIMSESEYSHSALEGVLPFRDVFTSVFFVSIGMLLDPAFVVTHLPQVDGPDPRRAAGQDSAGRRCRAHPGLSPACVHSGRIVPVPDRRVLLCPGRVGMGYNLLTAVEYQYFLAVAIVTMALTPSSSPGCRSFPVALPGSCPWA
jgi:Kef-type potassium/proton antiporter, CPA2 family (TC 2.A.37.1)